MPIPLTCPQCSKRHQAPDSLAGRQAKCGCGAILKVPASADRSPLEQPVATQAAQPGGKAWQARAAAAAGSWGSSSGGGGVAASESSVFDELSTSDMSRFQAARVEPADDVVAVTPAFNSHISPGVQDCLNRAKSEAAERQQVYDETTPQGVIYAICGFAVPGGLSLVFAIVLMVLMAQGIADLLFAFSGVLAVVHAILAVIDIGAAVMIHQKVPGARPVGYVVGVLNLCAGPLHIICVIMGMVGLSSEETIDYLAKPRKPLW